MPPSLPPSLPPCLSLATATTAMSHTLCSTRPPSLRVMPAVHPICPALGPSTPASASSSLLTSTANLTIHCAVCTTLERRQKPQKVQKHALILVLCCVRRRPCAPRSSTRGRCDPQPCCPGSLPASPELPSSSFEKLYSCNPCHATHAARMDAHHE